VFQISSLVLFEKIMICIFLSIISYFVKNVLILLKKKD